MPKMSGMALYEEIHKINPKVKTIFISGYSKDVIICTGMPSDKVRFINKPFTKQNLFTAIKSVLKK